MKDIIDQLEEENKLLKEKLQNIQELSKQKTTRKRRVLKYLGGLVAGPRLKKSIYQVVDQYTTDKRLTKEASSEFLASLLSRIIRVGFITILFAVLPSILLFQQNILIAKQNKKIEVQNHLTEASRRSSQMFIMSDVLSDINTELVTRSNKKLSDPLVGRIIALSRSMKPYRYIKNGVLIDTPISPERGQLLISLCRSKINSAFFSDEILQESDFTEAELTASNLFSANLKDVTLDNSNLRDSDFVNINFSNASLKNCNFQNVDLTDSTLRNANLSNSDLRFANLKFAELNGANLSNVKLDNAIVDKKDWLTHITTKLKLRGAEELAKIYKTEVISSTSKNKEYRLVKR